MDALSSFMDVGEDQDDEFTTSFDVDDEFTSEEESSYESSNESFSRGPNH